MGPSQILKKMVISLNIGIVPSYGKVGLVADVLELMRGFKYSIMATLQYYGLTEVIAWVGHLGV